MAAASQGELASSRPRKNFGGPGGIWCPGRGNMRKGKYVRPRRRFTYGTMYRLAGKTPAGERERRCGEVLFAWERLARPHVLVWRAREASARRPPHATPVARASWAGAWEAAGSPPPPASSRLSWRFLRASGETPDVRGLLVWGSVSRRKCPERGAPGGFARWCRLASSGPYLLEGGAYFTGSKKPKNCFSSNRQ